MIRLGGKVLAVIAAVGFGPAAFAGAIKWSEGSWQLELSGYKGLHQGSRDRTDDWNLNGVVEYESPIGAKSWTLSLRLQPLFYYNQDDDDDRDRHWRRWWWDDDDRDEGDDVWGVAFGPAIRVYANAAERRGLYAEASVSALVHANEFDGNSSNLNFISEFGVGYKFKSEWRVAAKWRHISNAGLGDHNAGVNAVGVAVGYRF